MIAEFSFPARIRFGAGASTEAAAWLETLRIRKPFLVREAELPRTPLLERLPAAEPFAAQGGHVAREQEVFDGAEAYVMAECDGILAVGNARTMQLAKGIRLKTGHSLSLADYDVRVGGGERIHAEDLPPLITLPVSAGSGAEASNSVALTLDRTGRKVVITSPHLAPTLVLADPALGAQGGGPCNRDALAGCLEAFGRCAEAFLATEFQPLCDLLAIGGIRQAQEAIHALRNKPLHMESWAALLLASLLTGAASQKGQGAACSLAYPLCRSFGLSHGAALAPLLPRAIDSVRQTTPERVALLENGLQTKDLAASAAELARKAGLPLRLRDLGVREDALPGLADEAAADLFHQAGPRIFPREEILAIYRAGW